MKHLFTIALMFLLGCSTVADDQSKATARPNIVFIMIDDLGYTDLGVTGSDYYLTPNIDKLASQSMVFNAAYANCANCAPTRAALMSGMYAPRTGVYTVGSPDRGNESDRVLVPSPNKTELGAEVITIAEVLKAAGYTTAHMGKWHLGQGPTGPKAQGFDVNIGGSEAGHPRSFFSPYQNVDIPDSPKGEYLTDRLTREAVAFMAEQKRTDKPFFLYLPLYTVHTPIQPHPEVLQQVQSQTKGKYHTNANYAAMVQSMDRYVGRVLDAIKSQGLADNTLVVFTSDNGGHGTYTDHHPLRGSKGLFYEGGIRVPLFVRYPGVTEAGTSFDEPVVLLDFYPTLAKVAGVTGFWGQQPIDGVSLLPVLRDPGKSLGRDAIFFHFPAYLQGYAGGEGAEAHRPPWRATPCSAIRSGDWKLIEYFETGEIELFNLKEDVGEQHDLSEQHADKAAELLNKLRAWREATDAPVPTEKNPKYKG